MNLVAFCKTSFRCWRFAAAPEPNIVENLQPPFNHIILIILLWLSQTTLNILQYNSHTVQKLRKSIGYLEEGKKCTEKSKYWKVMFWKSRGSSKLGSKHVKYRNKSVEDWQDLPHVSLYADILLARWNWEDICRRSHWSAASPQSLATWETENKIYCKQTLLSGNGPKTFWSRELRGDELILVGSYFFFFVLQ